MKTEKRPTNFSKLKIHQNNDSPKKMEIQIYPNLNSLLDPTINMVARTASELRTRPYMNSRILANRANMCKSVKKFNMGSVIKKKHIRQGKQNKMKIDQLLGI